ncbi:melanoma-associated antigen G1 [Elysia marginata]|uniref:Melanoma-associated antigen G1 n=1 Tax=Elysia marginata TaxID=1093978 RepID=A0AAV4FP58_9GAST|nr:melanoma-associated antigen G1 [Elysia marginata]
MAFNPSQSQAMSQSQSRPGTEISDPVEKEKKVNELVQYMLIMDQKKIPIKKKDINRVILKGQNRAFSGVMEEAASKLLEVYGFKVIEPQDKLKDSYILVNNLELNDSQRKLIEVNEKDKGEMGLVFVVLAMVFMNQNVIHEDEMWHALKKLGIFQDDVHSTFGNVKNLIMKEFVRKGYLRTELNTSTDPPTNDIYWGQRALHEISKADILSTVCEITETQPANWTFQMQQVDQQEQAMQTQDDANNPAPGPSSSR